MIVPLHVNGEGGSAIGAYVTLPGIGFSGSEQSGGMGVPMVPHPEATISFPPAVTVADTPVVFRAKVTS